MRPEELGTCKTHEPCQSIKTELSGRFAHCNGTYSLLYFILLYFTLLYFTLLYGVYPALGSFFCHGPQLIKGIHRIQFGHIRMLYKAITS
jgi:hypothetical protein